MTRNYNEDELSIKATVLSQELTDAARRKLETGVSTLSITTLTSATGRKMNTVQNFLESLDENIVNEHYAIASELRTIGV